MMITESLDVFWSKQSMIAKLQRNPGRKGVVVGKVYISIWAV